MSKEIAIAIFHGLGDCINSTTMLKPIREVYPTRPIIWISSEAYAPIAHNNPLIDEVISVPGNVWAADNKYEHFATKYRTLLQPAPYRHRASENNILLESYQERIFKFTQRPLSVFEPLLYMTQGEIDQANTWLTKKKVNNYVMLETNFTSSQSFWGSDYTVEAIKILDSKGYTILLTHPVESKLDEYNQYGRVLCLDVGFRLMPYFYNNAKGFVGVSSGISCAVHTHQCRKDIPHLEFVRGEHWCTRLYPKDNKVISFKKEMEHVKSLIRDRI